MERIVLNVDDANGIAYNSFSPEYKKQFNRAVNLMLKKVVNSQSINGYQQMLDDIGKKAEAKGLTPDLLSELLQSND